MQCCCRLTAAVASVEPVSGLSFPHVLLKRECVHSACDMFSRVSCNKFAMCNMRLYCNSRPFWLKVCFSVARPPIPMRRDSDPFWDLGNGFGPVRRQGHKPALPWESGTFGFLAPAASSRLWTMLMLPEPVPRPAASTASSASTSGSACVTQGPGCFRTPGRGKELAWSSREERNKRAQALCRWSNLLRLAPKLFCSETVSKLPDQGGQALVDHLDVLFSKKSTNTLLCRAQPLTRFVLWHNKTSPGELLSEAVLWLHCLWLQKCAAASSIDSLVCSLNFVHGTLGLCFEVSAILSPRVRGLAQAHLRTKDEVEQAPALTVAQLRWLEYFAVRETGGEHSVLHGLRSK